MATMQWLVHDDDDNATVRPGDGRSSSGGNKDLSADNSPPAQVATKRRGRKPGPRTDGRPAITHVEAERRRRDKLNRRFCELRAAVPTVSGMDRASLLADAAHYIAELRRRVEQLEATKATVTASYPSGGGSSRLLLAEEKLEVRMAGTEAAALRLTTAARHAPARLMDSLRSLDLPVQHACVSRVGGVTVLDAVVEVPADALREEAALRAALLHWLQSSSGTRFASADTPRLGGGGGGSGLGPMDGPPSPTCRRSGSGGSRRFCELRAAVPTVSRMDRASLLADVVRYIAELRRRVEQLEATNKTRQRPQAAVAPASAPTVMTASCSYPLAGGGGSRLLEEEKLEVRMAGPEAAALRLTTAVRHAPARLMDALRSRVRVPPRRRHHRAGSRRRRARGRAQGRGRAPRGLAPLAAAGNGANHLVLEFPYTEVPEQWLMDSAGDNVQQPQEHPQPLVEVEHGAVWGDGCSLSSASAEAMSGNPPAAAAAVARRGRGGGTTRAGGRLPAVSHMEAERNRRDKLHRLFCDLRAAVPAVSRMDKASLLADAAAYIVELRTRVDQLEAEATRAAVVREASPFVDGGDAAGEEEEELEVRMVVGQREAALRLTTAARHRHVPARFMDALRSLDLVVRHACVCRLGGGTTVQDAVVDVPAELRDEGCLRAALLRRLKQSGG
ncbi:hypothetical protein U9M48_037960 [Paspalum notatum var. saurae]|uniref:Transcription factor n=1 Tax=Paspalum notatum var. saurae TaxID=547442 RepID=A0AAQ3UKF7_PASNO